MRALAIAPEPFFTPRGTPLSVYYRTLVTAELGAQVDLLTYGQGDDVDIPGVRIVRIPRFAWLGPVKVGPSLLKAFLDVFIFIWAIALMIRGRYDVVHAHEETVFFCRYLGPIFRFKLVYDMHSILSQQLVNFRFTRSRMLVGLFERLEDGCLAKADAVITISPALADHALQRVADPKRHHLIENSLFEEVRLKAPSDSDGDDGAGPDGDGSGAGSASGGDGAGPDGDGSGAGPASGGGEAETSTAALDAFVPAGRPVVLYAGTFESYQGIDLLLEGFARARNRRPDAFLLLLGGRPEQVERYRSLARELELGDDCRFGGQVPRSVAQRATREAAVLTSPRSTGSNTPLKIYEQLAGGVPLVATRIPAHTQVLSDEVCILVDADPDSIAAGLVAGLERGETIDQKVRNARELYDEKYSRPAYVVKMKRLLEGLAT